MKKWVAGIAVVLAAICFHPFEAADTGELLVAQTLMIEEEEDALSLWAAGLHATGKTAQSAVNQMADHAPGKLFLRQLKRIILCGGAEQLERMELPEEIPMGAVVYRSKEPAEALSERLEELEAVLEARERRERNLPTLAQLKNEQIEGAYLETGARGEE